MYRSQARFDPPAESFGAPSSLKSLQQQLDQAAYADAAAQLDALLRDNADQLTTIDGGLISVAAWIDALPTRQKNAVAEEYRKQFDAAARQALASLRQSPQATFVAFYALARRYPFSSVAAAAYVEAGDRAVLLGDALAAHTLFLLAQQSGWAADEAHADSLAACRVLAESPPASYRGRVAFDAAWYGRRDAVNFAKYFPLAIDHRFYLAGPRHMLAVSETGQILWRWASAEAWARNYVADRPPERGRGPVYAPVAFASAAGAQIIVARQPRGISRDSCLRAFRAADGKLLWSSEAGNTWDNLSLAGNPAISGRYLYASAVEFTEDSGKLVLAAVDLLDGRVVFKCPLGTMLDMRRAREDPRGWDDFWEQTEPAIAGDVVFMTPNVGYAFAVGRFDGKLRWSHAYADQPAAPAVRGRGFEEPTRLPPPTDPAELLRFNGTPQVCGNVLVIAPQDTSAVLGLDAATGHQLWRIDSPPAHTLIGHADRIAILVGDSIHGLDSATGKSVWSRTPATRLVGPPAIVGETLFVPTADASILTLSCQTGQPIDPKLPHPNFRRLLAIEPMRKALQEALMLPSFSVPAR
jgi:outer membrane protein assembly factor BamB